MNLKRTLLLLAAVLPLQLSAKVTLPAIFTDNMVLQQQSDVKIWGRAKPGKAVKVTTSWDGKTYAATASATGGWEVLIREGLMFVFVVYQFFQQSFDFPGRNLFSGIVLHRFGKEIF